jgi:hypothetical protein
MQIDSRIEGLMFKTVVWATDGCESAARALQYARALATGAGAMLIAAHTIQETTTDGPRHRAGERRLRGGPTEQDHNIVGGLSGDGLNAILKVVN